MNEACRFRLGLVWLGYVILIGWVRLGYYRFWLHGTPLGIVGTDVGSRFMPIWSAYVHMAALVLYIGRHNLIKLPPF